MVLPWVEARSTMKASAAADSPERQVYDWLSTEDGIRCIEKAGYVPAV